MSTLQQHDRWTTEDHVTDEELIDQWQGMIRKVASTITRCYRLSAEDREDLVSCVYLKLLRMPESKRPFIGYVKRTIDNAARSSLSKLRAAGGGGLGAEDKYTMGFAEAAPKSSAKDPDDDDGAAIDRITEPDSTSEDRLVLRMTLESAITQLSPREQEVIRMHLDGLSGVDIAQVFGVNVATVSMILSRAVKRLRRAMVKNYF